MYKYLDTKILIINYYGIFFRFVGNLIISYELYQNGELNASYMKMIEIDNWLKKLDNGSDEFYLSINNALKHIRMANFIHMLFAENETGGFKLVNYNLFIIYFHLGTQRKVTIIYFYTDLYSINF